jgi:hypothetical protein
VNAAFLSSFLALLAICASVASASFTAISFTSSSAQTGDGPVNVGFTFTPTTDIQIRELGLWDNPAVAGIIDTPVGIYENASNTLLVSTTIGAADPLAGNFRFKIVPSVNLTAGVTYTAVALANVTDGYQIGSLGDPVIDLSKDPFIGFGIGRYSYGGVLARPLNNANDLEYFNANFQFILPEPASASLVLLAGTALLRRSRRHR